MPQKQLAIANLQDLDGGRAASEFNYALQQIVTDVIERSGDRSRRKVILTVDAEPIIDKATGALDNISVQFQIQTRIPHRQTRQYPMLPTRDGLLLFQTGSPLDPRQNDLPYGQGNRQDAKATAEDAEKTSPEP